MSDNKKDEVEKNTQEESLRYKDIMDEDYKKYPKFPTESYRFEFVSMDPNIGGPFKKHIKKYPRRKFK